MGLNLTLVMIMVSLLLMLVFTRRAGSSPQEVTEINQIVKLLLAAGANVNLRNTSGRTALMFAAIKGDALIVELLLKAGADKTVRDITQKTAMDWAITEKHFEVASQLEYSI